jgi:hypothetical protein
MPRTCCTRGCTRLTSIGRISHKRTLTSCEIFSGYVQCVEANGDASTRSQRIRPTQPGKNIVPTRRRSRPWPPSEPLELRQIRWSEDCLVNSQSSSSRGLQFCYVQANPPAHNRQTFVRVHCAQCHAIDKVSDSPLTIAPRSAHCTSNSRSRVCAGAWPKVLLPTIRPCRNFGSIRIRSRMS